MLLYLRRLILISLFASSSAYALPESPRCSGPAIPKISSLPLKYSSRAQALGDGYLDLLVGYTPDSLSKFGNTLNLSRHIQLLVTHANQSFLQSGVAISLRIVQIVPLSTAATDNFSNDLSAATEQDGIWDELLTLREQYHADMVSVVVGGSQRGERCGLGWLNGVTNDGPTDISGSAHYMFNIVSVNPICDTLALAHEVGHNLGADHDRENSQHGSSTKLSSYGYRFTGASKQLWRTIMAVDPGWQIPYFSTPNVLYDGVPIGVSGEADNVSLISQNAPIVSEFYSSFGGGISPVSGSATPSSLQLNIKMVSGKRVITATLLRNLKPIPYGDITLHFSYTKNGSMYSIRGGRTNSKGIMKLSAKKTTYPNGYYKVCHLKASTKRICSKMVWAT